MENNYFPSLTDASNDVLGINIKRSLNNGPPQRNSPNISLANSTNSQATNLNLNRIFQPYPSSTLSIPSIYSNPNLLYTSPNLSQINQQLNLSKQLNLPIDRQEYLNVLNATNLTDLRDNNLQGTALQLNTLQHRRRPSLLQSTALSTDLGFQSQYLPYLNEKFRENLRNKAFLPQPYPNLSNTPLIQPIQSNNGQQTNLNQSLNAQQFNPHQLAQSTSLNFLPQPNQPASYLDNETTNLLLNSNKRPRLQPLLIDTNIEIKKEPAYTVQVEAISPTPNEDTRPDGSPTKTTKDDILGQISQIDREITQTDNQISKLKKKQQELEALTNKTGKSSDLNEYLDSKQQSVTQIVYFENRKKAQDSQHLLDELGPKVILPIYNQPSDTKVYHENREKFIKFKQVLQQHFRRKLKRKQDRERFLTEHYDHLMQEWLQKLESKDTNPVKKNKDNKLREFFEKQFPELKKQREDKERLSRAGQRVRSDADLEDIMDGIQEQELEDKKIRAYAVIPPILYDENERVYRFKTNNCKITDPVSVYKELTYLNVWTTSEKEIFKEKFLQSPKNFGLIASYLERKSVMDCVQYYYSSKKRENYKQLLRKNAKKRTRALAKQQQAAQQQQQQQEQTQRSLTQAKNLAKQQLELERDNLLKTNAGGDKLAINDEVRVKDELNVAKVKTEEDDENCIKCVSCLKKIEPNSKVYVINRTNCFLYGLNAEDIKRNSRLCKKCKTEFGTGSCPVPSCKAIKKLNRRLKTLPREWFELTPENRYTFSAELNFPLDCKRCCTRCWIRLVRKYLNFSSSVKNTTMKKYLNCNWDDNEIEKLKDAIQKNGRDWDVISSLHVITKTAKQCRQFYFYFKYNLNLDELMKLKTFQTNDFDSDACWKELSSDNESSEDEYLIERRPIDLNLNLERLQDCKKLSSSQISIKSDSSATMSADESNLGEFVDSRITPPSRSSSVLAPHLSNAYNHDKLRPLSTDNIDIDSKSKTNQKYLNQQKQKTPLNKPSQMPALFKYLINPNAPTVQSSASQQQQTRIKQDSPISNLQTIPTPAVVNLQQPQQPQTITPAITPQLFTAGNQQQQQQQTSQQTSKEKDKTTCVRDLIYHTIDKTFQADKIGGNAGSKQLDQQQAQLKDNKSQQLSQSSNLPLFFASSDIKREISPLIRPSTADPASLQHMISYGLPGLIPTNPATMANLAGVGESLDNEVQDLSKKSNKKDLQPNLVPTSSAADDYLKPKNYSLAKQPIKNEFVNLSFPSNQTSSMPPPAHSNTPSLSGRTSTTPGPILNLDLASFSGLTPSQQEQVLQSYYLNVNRHTDSPRSNLMKSQQSTIYTPNSERITPNHLLSTAPSPNSNRLPTSSAANSAASKSNQQQPKMMTGHPPPPLLNTAASNLSKLSNPLISNKSQGSITQGTPINFNPQSPLDLNALQQQIFLNSLNAKEREAAVGSIQQGTSMYRRPNMPKLNTAASNAAFLSAAVAAAQTNTPPFNVNFPTSQNNLKQESQLSSTQNQIMIDFNTSKQMQKQHQRVNSSGSSLADSSKERNSPLSLNLLNQFSNPAAAYSQLQLGAVAGQIGLNPAAMNTIFDLSNLNNLNKSQSPLLAEAANASNRIHSNSPKISQSPNARQNIIQQQQQHSIVNYSQQQQLPSTQLGGKNTPSSVIQTSSSNKQPMYSQSQAHDFQTFQTLVNTAAAQQSLTIPTTCESSINKKLTEDEKNIFNHSALKFSRKPYTKEQLEKELKSQELIKKQQQQNEQQVKIERKTPSTTSSNILSNPELDNEASKIFSNSFQKDQSGQSSQMLTAANLIDLIVCRSINQPDTGKTVQQQQAAIKNNGPKDDIMNLLAQQASKANTNLASYANSNVLNDQIKSLFNLGQSMNQSMNQSLNPSMNPSMNPSLNPSINPSQLLHDRNLALNVPVTSKSSDDQSWKLRKALEQKEAQQRKEGNKSMKSHLELEPISPPSTTPTKELGNSLTQSSLSNLQLASKHQADAASFHQDFQNRIEKAMNLDQLHHSVKDASDEVPAKKAKLENEEMKKEKINLENLNQDKLTQPGLESISLSSLSELKAQKAAAEFQKQQQLKLKDDKSSDMN